MSGFRTTPAANLYGYIPYASTTLSQTCRSDSTFASSGTNAGCVSSGEDVNLFTQCNSGTIYWSGSSTPCATGLECHTDFVWETLTDNKPDFTRYYCWSGSILTTPFFRQYPALTSATTTEPVVHVTSTASLTNSTSGGITTVYITATPGSSILPTQAGVPGQSSEESAKSQISGLSGGAIAGIAIGVVGVVVALFLLALFFLRDRLAGCFGRIKQGAEQTGPEAGALELSTDNPIHEMGPSGLAAGDGFMATSKSVERKARPVSEIGSST